MVSLIWVITGVILFGAMIAGAIRIWLKKRRENMEKDSFVDVKPLDEDNSQV